MLKPTNRADSYFADRIRLRQKLATANVQLADLNAQIVKLTRELAEEKSRSGSYWGMFSAVQDKHHALRKAVDRQGMNADELIGNG